MVLSSTLFFFVVSLIYHLPYNKSRPDFFLLPLHRCHYRSPAPFHLPFSGLLTSDHTAPEFMAGYSSTASDKKSSDSADDIPIFNAENLQNNLKIIYYRFFRCFNQLYFLVDTDLSFILSCIKSS